MKILIASLALVIGSTTPLAAATYIGPGAGLSLLGALWALLAAVFTAMAFVVAWPVRKMLLRKREQRRRAPGQDEKDVEPVSIPHTT